VHVHHMQACKIHRVCCSTSGHQTAPTRRSVEEANRKSTDDAVQDMWREEWGHRRTLTFRGADPAFNLAGQLREYACERAWARLWVQCGPGLLTRLVVAVQQEHDKEEADDLVQDISRVMALRFVAWARTQVQPRCWIIEEGFWCEVTAEEDCFDAEVKNKQLDKKKDKSKKEGKNDKHMKEGKNSKNMKRKSGHDTPEDIKRKYRGRHNTPEDIKRKYRGRPNTPEDIKRKHRGRPTKGWRPEPGPWPEPGHRPAAGAGPVAGAVGLRGRSRVTDPRPEPEPGPDGTPQTIAGGDDAFNIICPCLEHGSQKDGQAPSGDKEAGKTEGTEVQRSVCKQLLESIAIAATKEVKDTGKFTISGWCMLNLKNKPASWQEGDLREVGGSAIPALHRRGRGTPLDEKTKP